MKRKISLILFFAILLTAMATFGISADTTDYDVNFTHNMDSGIQKHENTSSVGLSATQADRLGDSGNGLVLKTQSKGNSVLASKRTKLFNLTNGNADGDTVIPVGDYKISLWVRHNSDATGSDWAYNNAIVKSYISFALYGVGTVESNSLSVSDAVSLKLLPGTNNGDFKLMEDSGVTPDAAAPKKIWYKYTAEVTLTQPCEKVAFWVINETENQESTNYTACVENLTLEGNKTAHTEGITFRGFQRSLSVEGEETFSLRLVSTVDTANYRQAGYDISVSYVSADGNTEESNSDRVVLNTLYKTIYGTAADESTISYKSSYYNAGYIGQLVVTDLPTDGTVTVKVTAFAVSNDGKTYTDKEYTVVFDNGVHVPVE